ncbi:hypothetical protein A2363_03640 [Candidatus Gottesmanbacteria bacterium RIFOXYB1_FULL_47_11]|uniref:Xylose isomerase-like TIM barrel domain-containing protein n=1 Tax=Candidatus Gottesmanbacteria bacterium RIFOXYB1_FULL_47_11 TaxID=1798401 RepID=A0A1F6BFR6_9BACT|nr:MAG: hypothetical protein A2363_03640 [Candidatus Gottesmanbacteria bacterium RIFOXYB1_FULL_47_11]
MKLGIKVAPGNDWKNNIEAAHPAMVEIWYNASRPDDYTGIFAYLAHTSIDVGLHYWGALPSGLLTNASYPDPAVSEPSLALMRATIDSAAAHKCVYVNIHPDLYNLLQVNFDTMGIRVASKQADPKAMNETFIQNTLNLNAYAAARGVVLTVETVPSCDTPSWKPGRDRTDVINTHPIPMSVLVDLAHRGVAVANDFGHTASNVISDDRAAVWRYLYDTTRTLEPVTRLIHLGFIEPPYNGVDFHDSLDNPVLETSAAIPNKKEMAELLQLFKTRDDVWILVEPRENHVKNYHLAQKIIASV